MGNLIDITGIKYGMLTVIKFSEMRKEKAYWLCVCDCENECVVVGNNLKNYHTQSCGCKHKDANFKRLTTHGMCKSSEYRIWSHMLERCSNNKAKSFKNYGGRGITVCEKWLTFEGFYEDMGDRPEVLTLDRKNVNGNYEKDNCRWATQKVQQNNRTNNRVVTYLGSAKTVSQWSEEFNIKYKILYDRINKHKWSIERALTTKIREAK